MGADEMVTPAWGAPGLVIVIPEQIRVTAQSALGLALLAVTRPTSIFWADQRATTCRAWRERGWRHDVLGGGKLVQAGKVLRACWQQDREIVGGGEGGPRLHRHGSRL